MLKNLLAKLGLGAAAPAPTPAAAAANSDASGAPQPYAEAHLNFLYNLLFCDDLDLFRRRIEPARPAADASRDSSLRGNDERTSRASGTSSTSSTSGTSSASHTTDEPWRTLLATEPAPAALRAIADDANAESRVRALAFRRLREIGHEVPPKILLGVIVEVPLERGLDTLAAYADGRVRYLNQSGAASIFEGGPPAVETLARELIVTALPLVQRIGPWESARLPPPPRGAVRMSFLVSDGLYFGQGSFAQLQQDRLGGPVLSKASELLQAVVAAAR